MSVPNWSFWISPLAALFVFMDVVGTGGALAATVVMGDRLLSTKTTSVPAVTTDTAVSSTTMETGSTSNTEIGSFSTTETGSVNTFETASTSINEKGSTNTFETASTSTFKTRSTMETGSINTFEIVSTTGTGSTSTFETGSTSTFETGSSSTFGTGSTNTSGTGSTNTSETGSTSTFKTINTIKTGSTSSFETGSTSTFETGSTTGTRSTSTFKTTNTIETGSTSTIETINTIETGSTSTFETESTTGTGSTGIFETGSSFETGSTGTFVTGSSSLGVTEPCQQQQLCSAGVCVPGCSSPSYNVQTSDTGSGSTARNILLHFVTTVMYRGALSAHLTQPLKGSDAGDTSTMDSTLAPPSSQTHLVTSRNTTRSETSDVFMSSIMDTLREFNLVQTTGEQSLQGRAGQSTGPAEPWENIVARTNVTAANVATSDSMETIAESTQGMTPPTKLYSEPTRTTEPTLSAGQSSMTSTWPTKTTVNFIPGETSSTPTMTIASVKWAGEEPTRIFSEPTRTTSGFQGEEPAPIFSESGQSTGDPNQIWLDTTSRSSPVLSTQYNYWEEIMGERAVFVDSTPSYTGPGLIPHDNNSGGFVDFGFLIPEADSSSLSQTTVPSTTKTSTSVDAQTVKESTTTTLYLSTTSGALGYVSTSHVAVLPDEREAHDLADRKSSSIGPEKLPEDAIVAGVRSTSWPRDVRSTSPGPGPVAAPTTHTSIHVNDIHVKTEKGLNSEDPETIAKNYLPPLPEDKATPHVGQPQQESQYLQILLVAAPSAVAFLSLLGLTCLTCCMCKYRYRRWMAIRRAKRRMQKEQKKAKKKKQYGKAHVEDETRHGNRETADKKRHRRHRPPDNDLLTTNSRQPVGGQSSPQGKPSKNSRDHEVIHQQHPVPDKN